MDKEMAKTNVLRALSEHECDVDKVGDNSITELCGKLQGMDDLQRSMYRVELNALNQRLAYLLASAG